MVDIILVENEKAELKPFTFKNDKTKLIQLPNEEPDPFSFIAVNPEDEKGIVITTHNNDIYLTKDEGDMG